MTDDRSSLRSKRPMYFGVLSNRDRIKVRGEAQPFWMFLDRQPDGWLASLAYFRHIHTVLPVDDTPRMFDCGAWSYKAKDIPVLGKRHLTADVALTEYSTIARTGDFVVAPDHMLIDGVDVNARRRFNRSSAARWLDVVPPHLRPVAVVHGDSVRERVKIALEYQAWGYRDLAIGGLAARASQPKVVMEIVSQVRRAFDGWLHVLGLSSPKYAAKWRDLGVNSFDGSSHFKQAFIAGAFYTLRSSGQMVKYLAAKPGEPITAPACECRACLVLAEVGINTRQYGSNEHNMGRAAHNLNMLMRAHEVVYAQPCCPELV